MTNWSAYEARINLNGSSKRERLINNAKNSISKNIVDSPSLFSVTINGVSNNLVIISTDNDYERVIHALPNHNISAGNTVVFNSTNWIITEVSVENEIYMSGKMTFCPNILKFQNSTGTILTRPYFVDTSSPSLSQNNTVTTSDSIRNIIISFDDETKLSHADKRFMGEFFNGIPQMWKIIDLNSEIKKGLLSVTLQKDEYHKETDNIEFEIADYYEPISPTPSSDCLITFLGQPEVKIGGTAKKFTAVFKDEDGNALNNISVVWNTVIPTGFGSYFNIQSNGYFITIQALDNINLDGKIITLNLASADGAYSTRLDIKVVNTI